MSGLLESNNHHKPSRLQLQPQASISATLPTFTRLNNSNYGPPIATMGSHQNYFIAKNQIKEIHTVTKRVSQYSHPNR